MKTFIRPSAAKIMLLFLSTVIVAGIVHFTNPAFAAAADFGPSNPFFAPSTLPFQAPPFDKIKDEDFQPAIEAGMAQQQVEIQAIADNPDAPTFDNTLVVVQKSGQLFDRAMAAFNAV